MKKEGYYIVSADGASKGNPGRASGGFIVVSPEGKIVLEKGFFIGENFTNNDAEYIAILYALTEALKIGAKRIKLLSDSQVVLRQLKGEYKIRKKFHRLLHEEVMKKIKQFEAVKIEEVKRENKYIVICDRLANSAEKRERILKRKFNS